MVGGGGARGAPCKRGTRGGRREKGSTNTSNGGEKEKEEEVQLKQEGPSPGPPPSPGERLGGSPGGGQRPPGSLPGGSRGVQGAPGDSQGPSRPTLLLGAELASYDEVKVCSMKMVAILCLYGTRGQLRMWVFSLVGFMSFNKPV